MAFKESVRVSMKKGEWTLQVQEIKRVTPTTGLVRVSQEGRPDRVVKVDLEPEPVK